MQSEGLSLNLKQNEDILLLSPELLHYNDSGIEISPIKKNDHSEDFNSERKVSLIYNFPVTDRENLLANCNNYNCDQTITSLN